MVTFLSIEYMLKKKLNTYIYIYIYLGVGLKRKKFILLEIKMLMWKCLYKLKELKNNIVSKKLKMGINMLVSWNILILYLDFN
jgi:hypothetical protein